MPGILCEHCTAICCRYIALPIEKPKTRSDFDDIRWYLLHEGVGIFVEDGDWYITLNTTCRHLQADNRCGIYETRPRICRDYSTDNCDYHSGDYGWELHFATPEHLDEYVQERFSRRGGRKRSKGKPSPGTRGEGRVRGKSPQPDGLRSGRKVGGNSRIKVKLRNPRLHRKPAYDYSAATTDTRGVPLPVLRLDP